MKQEKVNQVVEETEGRARILTGWQLKFVASIAFLWSLFQLWYASPFPFMVGFGVFIDVPARAIHLGFALFLAFLSFPFYNKNRKKRFNYFNFFLSILAFFVTFYLFYNYENLVYRNGILLKQPINIFGTIYDFPTELIIGFIGIALLLEATRRAIGTPLVIVASIFLIYSIFGQSMPELISHQGLSLKRLVGYHWFGGEAIFGIPISVSVSFVFLFVLFGSMLDYAGGGKYFLSLAISLVGKFRGGPAKASIMASGLTGMISGSSIANVVTTGTFTIPIMKKTGFPAVKAGAIEVAASVNGQIMPPIMGAAAFIIAEMLGITYFEVIKHAFIPAVIVYLSLFWISDLEASKLGLKGMPKNEIPELGKTFRAGIHFLIPILLLIYLLIIKRWTAGSSVFYSIICMMGIMLIQKINFRKLNDFSLLMKQIQEGLSDIVKGMIRGAMNMVNVAIAIATAGIIVGAVGSTGLSNAMIEVVEVISGGNIIILLFMVMVLCLILGLGLPTTANYLVVAALMANVIVEIGGASGIILPLIAVHLYVFYFGLMADVTPPVGLAAYAASAISRADPIKTGIQAFWYEIRTAILPIVFIFNPELLLIGVESIWHGLLIFCVSLIAIFAFTSAAQGWLLTKLKWYEIIALLLITVSMFRPDFIMNRIYPEYTELRSNFDEEIFYEETRKIRLHVTRYTDYGERYKMFAFLVEPKTSKSVLQLTGIELEKNSNNNFDVVNLEFMGPGEKKGMDFYDEVTKLEINSLDRPPKELVYIFGLIILGLVLFNQRRRL
ncbi:MAG: TRAP transporter permease [Pelagibacteraceae bacterium]|jgi:TRAP transporter 4TM/12TM fusion protein|nr:TRAP transporter permease [Pelagibacteraceae bacterium]MBT6689231.1 TRAP transporter permease [Flavobacteriaceae bacterium]MBT4645262.1 TRAP transporter permease [Pelagibacteraceae bacterium]MBT4951904.1 TRAP transporter permease [Pelagibacteraceae bacterium]MBT5214124.1 TRAP transporter permease [Pelagibacteraceae bacterium]